MDPCADIHWRAPPGPDWRPHPTGASALPVAAEARAIKTESARRLLRARVPFAVVTNASRGPRFGIGGRPHAEHVPHETRRERRRQLGAVLEVEIRPSVRAGLRGRTPNVWAGQGEHGIDGTHRIAAGDFGGRAIEAPQLLYGRQSPSPYGVDRQGSAVFVGR